MRCWSRQVIRQTDEIVCCTVVRCLPLTFPPNWIISSLRWPSWFFGMLSCCFDRVDLWLKSAPSFHQLDCLGLGDRLWGLSDKFSCIHRVLPLTRRKMGDVELVESDDGADSRQELSMVASKLFLTEFVVPDKEK